MEPRPRIIVSMTSYPARIKNVPISVFALVKRSVTNRAEGNSVSYEVLLAFYAEQAVPGSRCYYYRAARVFSAVCNDGFCLPVTDRQNLFNRELDTVFAYFDTKLK